MIVYFGEEVERALTDYLELQRNGITPLSGHEDALFLSGQKKKNQRRCGGKNGKEILFCCLGKNYHST